MGRARLVSRIQVQVDRILNKCKRFLSEATAPDSNISQTKERQTCRAGSEGGLERNEAVERERAVTGAAGRKAEAERSPRCCFPAAISKRTLQKLVKETRKM